MVTLAYSPEAIEKAPEIISEPAKPKEKSPTQVSLFDMFDEEN